MSDADRDIAAALACCVVGWVVLGLVLGPAGTILALRGHRRGGRHAVTVAVLGVAVTIAEGLRIAAPW